MCECARVCEQGAANCTNLDSFASASRDIEQKRRSQINGLWWHGLSKNAWERLSTYLREFELLIVWVHGLELIPRRCPQNLQRVITITTAQSRKRRCGESKLYLDNLDQLVDP